MTNPTPLSLEREELKAKSLGEKMFDALHYDSRTKSAVWSSVPDRSRDYYEIAGMAFAASLTHDETASAVIASLTARAEKAEQQLEAARKTLAGCHEVKPMHPDRLERILDFEEHAGQVLGPGDTASLSWSDQRALIDEAVIAFRAREALFQEVESHD